MHSPSFTPIGVFATLALFLAGCSADPIAPPSTGRVTSGGDILTSFDRVTVGRGEGASFRASVIGAGARLSSAGITFLARSTSVARVTAADGRAQVQGLASGRTWVVVQNAAEADSVEVIVE